MSHPMRMTTANQIAQAAAARVAAWQSEERAALIARLSTVPVVKKLNHGYSVDLGEALPRWCADAEALRKLLDERSQLVAGLRVAA